ncbi:NRDE family protein [Aquimarina agarilytica]|uniref:NRDE family protein n=1 Tax=Aquimarina agarilytica TaxID=1087449 RepID=UPI000288839C|nr:NRDE family protein [Aquimarina agarilytica]
MCTVTLVSLNKNSFILTSNRDEAIGRKTLPIASYAQGGKRLLYPKDEVAGGTWIAASDEQTMICLLNGGYKNHVKAHNYRHSRGVVVTDILTEGNLWEAMQNYNCEGLEPFTLVGVDWNSELKFYELVWDGSKKHIRKLATSHMHIWSSSTLYTDEMKQMRKDWLADFKLNNSIDKDSLIHFHKNGGIGNEYYDLQIKRGDLQTRSITQVCAGDRDLQMRYEDLVINKVFQKSFETVNI